MSWCTKKHFFIFIKKLLSVYVAIMLVFPPQLAFALAEEFVPSPQIDDTVLEPTQENTEVIPEAIISSDVVEDLTSSEEAGEETISDPIDTLVGEGVLSTTESTTIDDSEVDVQIEETQNEGVLVDSTTISNDVIEMTPVEIINPLTLEIKNGGQMNAGTLEFQLSDRGIDGYSDGQILSTRDVLSQVLFIDLSTETQETKNEIIEQASLVALPKIDTTATEIIEPVVESPSVEKEPTSEVIPTGILEDANIQVDVVEETGVVDAENTTIDFSTTEHGVLQGLVDEVIGTAGVTMETVFDITLTRGEKTHTLTTDEYFFKNGSIDLVIAPKSRAITPGHYVLNVAIHNPISNTTELLTQDLYWGVLALNFAQDVYNTGEVGTFAVGVLDDEGYPYCNAQPTLSIQKPDGNTETIGVNHFPENCSVMDSMQTLPDYGGEYIFDQTGTYEITLSANNGNGERFIRQFVTVSDANSFVITRDAATRLYPFGPSQMTFSVYSKDGFTGSVTEVVPSSFDIAPKDDEYAIFENGDTKTIVWNAINLVAGETQTFSYIYDAPDISPEFYLLGGIILGNSDNPTLYTEKRQWQIANDETAESLTSGLVRWYKFNEGSGTAPQDSSVTNADITGNNIDAADWTSDVPTGSPNNPYSLNIDTSEVAQTTTAGLNGLTVGSWSVWVKPTTLNPSSGTRAIVFNQYESPTQNNGPFLGLYTDQTYMGLWNGYGGGGIGGYAVAGTWSHFAMTNDGVNSKMYKDGVLLFTSGGSVAPAVFSGSCDIVFGNASSDCSAPFVNQPYSGKIDDFRIYNRALTDSEVLQLAAANLTGRVISGTVYTDQGVTAMGTGRTVRLLKNGIDTGLTDDTDASGNYSINMGATSIINEDKITLYLDNETENAVTVSKATYGGDMDIDLYQNRVIVRTESGPQMSLENMDTANNGDTDITALYSDGATPVFTAASEVLVWTGSTFDPGGILNLLGDFEIMSTGTLSHGSYAININGNFINNGTLTHTGVLTFIGGATGTKDFNPGSATIGSDIALTYSSGVTPVVRLVTNNLNNGANDIIIGDTMTLYLNGKNITSTGTSVSGSAGKLRLNGNETVSVPVNAAYGINIGVEYVGDGDGLADTYTLVDWAGTQSDYNSITINSTDSNDTFRAGGTDLNVAKNANSLISINNGIFDANGKSVLTNTLFMDGGTYLAKTATQHISSISMSAGTFTGSTGQLIGGTYNLTGGTFTAPSTIMYMADFGLNGGTFTHNSGTAIFNSLSNSVYAESGSITFNNLSLIKPNVGASATIEFGDSNSVIVAGQLMLNGFDADDNIIITSDGGSTVPSILNVTGTFGTNDFLQIDGNTLKQNGVTKSPALNPANSTGTDALGWFTGLTGTIYTDEGTTIDTSGRVIKLLKNGVDTGLSDTASTVDGTFGIQGATFASGDILTFVAQAGTYLQAAATIVKAGSSSATDITGIDIYQQYVIVRNDSTGSLTPATLDTAHDGSINMNFLYPEGSTTALNLETTVSFLVWTGDTFNTTGGGYVGGNLTIQSGATFNPGSGYVTVSGSVTNNGTYSGTGTLEFWPQLYSQSTRTFKPGSATLGTDIIVSTGAIFGGTLTLTGNNLNIGANNLTVDADFILNGKNLTATGTFSNTGGITLFGSETVTITANDTDSGGWAYVGDNDGVAENFTIKDFGTTDYYNIYI